jgi:Mrp family chromosome partitioning ATPase
MRVTTSLRLAAFVAAIFVFAGVPAARAQQEFPPPQGKGRVVVVSSGMSGPAHYTQVASEIAALGYDVLLVDGNSEENSDALKTFLAN